MKFNHIIAFLLISCFAFAQNFLIKGQVINQVGAPLIDAHVFGQNFHTATNQLGMFELVLSKSKPFKLKVSHLGYMALDTILPHINQSISLVLKQKVEQLNPIQITENVSSKSSTVIQTNISQVSLQAQKQGSLADLVQQEAGVSVLKMGQNIQKPIINGLHSSRVGVFVQGIGLEDQQWGIDHSPSVNLNGFNQVSVVKGASLLQYGSSHLGGMILLEQKPVVLDTMIGQTTIFTESNGLGGGFATQYQWLQKDQWSWNAGLGYKQLGDLQTPAYNLENTGSRNAHLNLQAFKRKANRLQSISYYGFWSVLGVLRSSHLGNVTDLFEAIMQQNNTNNEPFAYQINRPKQDIMHHQVVYDRKTYDENEGYKQWLIGLQYNHRQEFDVRRNANEQRPALQLNLLTQDVQWHQKKRYNSFDLKYGIQSQIQLNQSLSPLGVRVFIPSYFKLNLGGYLVAEMPLKNHLFLEGGIRYQYQYLRAQKRYLKSRWEQLNYHADFAVFITGSSGISWETSPKFQFHQVATMVGLKKLMPHDWKGLLNLHFIQRNPDVAELFADGLHHSLAQIELGNLRNQPEQSLKALFQISKDWQQSSFEISPFAHLIHQYLFLKPIGFESTIRGAFPVWEYQQTNAFLAGVDVKTTWQMAKFWHLNSQLAYLYGQDVTNNQPLIDMPPFNTLNELNFEAKQWQFSLSHQWVSRQNRFPDFNFETNIVNSQNELTPVLVDISTPPAAYQLLNFRVSKNLNLFKETKTKVMLTVNNLTNSVFRDYLNRQRFFADELGRNFLLQIQFNY